MLARLDPTDCALLARVAKPWLAVVLANYLPRAGKGGSVRLKLVDFVGSVRRLAWAKDNGCPWHERNLRTAAEGGHLEVLQWAREHGCLLDRWTCTRANRGIWRHYRGRASKIAREMRVHAPQRAGTWRC